MATFIIDINEDITPVEYTAHTGVTTEYNCVPDSEQRYNLKMESASLSEYGMISSYSGDQWKYLTLHNITEDIDGAIKLYYDGVQLTNADFPLQIDIETVSSINNIPLFEVVIDNYESLVYSKTKKINLSFSIEDINGTIGSILLSSFQLKILECLTPPVLSPTITSGLYHEIGVYAAGEDDTTDYLFEYYIEADNPVTSYATSTLPEAPPPYDPEVSLFNSTTGYIRIECWRLKDRHVDKEYQFDISAINSGAVPTTDTKTLTLIVKALVPLN